MKKLFVVFAACALVFAFTAPTMAADWDFYGSARMATFSEDTDIGPDESVRTTTWALQGNSRVGAKVAANDNGIGGRFEYGTGVNVRLLYGTWNFGPGELLVGQDYTPTTDFISNQVWATDNDLIGLGMPYGGRQPQIKLKMSGFEFALISPSTPLPAGYIVKKYVRIPVQWEGGATSVEEIYTGDVTLGTIETTFPKMEAAYSFKTDMFFVRPYVGFNTFNVRQFDSRDRTVDSWLFGGTLGVTPGPFYFKGGLYYGTNPAEYGLSNGPGGSQIRAQYIAATSEVVDVETWGFQALIGYTLNEMLAFEVGYGYTSYEWDTDNSVDFADMVYYANMPITFAPGFFIVPEIGYVDREDVKIGTATNEKDTFYVGLKWQINF